MSASRGSGARSCCREALAARDGARDARRSKKGGAERRCKSANLREPAGCSKIVRLWNAEDLQRRPAGRPPRLSRRPTDTALYQLVRGHLEYQRNHPALPRDAPSLMVPAWDARERATLRMEDGISCVTYCSADPRRGDRLWRLHAREGSEGVAKEHRGQSFPSPFEGLALKPPALPGDSYSFLYRARQGRPYAPIRPKAYWARATASRYSRPAHPRDVRGAPLLWGRRAHSSEIWSCSTPTAATGRPIRTHIHETLCAPLRHPHAVRLHGFGATFHAGP